jgi:hypothetical protein
MGDRPTDQIKEPKTRARDGAREERTGTNTAKMVGLTNFSHARLWYVMPIGVGNALHFR